MVSFDIFDTLITRMTYTPAGVFAIAAYKVLATYKNERFYYDGIVEDFVSLRMSAEKDARRRGTELGKKEITLGDIYNVVQEGSFIDKSIVYQIKEAEVQAEIDCAVAIQQNLEIVKRYCDTGENIVLISDMYLSGASIRKILKKAAPEISDLPLYVSSDVGCVKSDGSLFAHVNTCEKADYFSWIHYGDDRQSDYIIPKALGIDIGAVYLPTIPKTLFYYYNNTNPYDLHSQISMGIMKNIVGYNIPSVLSKNDQTGYITAVTVGGLLIYDYVRWILDDCVNNKIKDIYFLSRDGYILKKVADIIIGEEKTSIITHYLYSSRIAWQATNGDVLVNYAEQEIDLDNSVAFVDIQGTGQTVNCFVRAIRSEYKSFRPTVYYYAYDFVGLNLDYNIKSYSFDKEDYLLEVLCRAPEDQTVGYKSENGIIKPVFEETGIIWKDTGIGSYINGVCEYVKLFLIEQKKIGVEIKNRKFADIIKGYLLNVVDEDVDDFLGNMPFEYSEKEGIQLYAQPFSIQQATEIYLLGKQELIGGVRRKIAIRRSSDVVKNKISDLSNPSYILSSQEDEILNCFIRTNIDRKPCPQKKKCILYGAGEYGRTLYRILNNSNSYDVIAWTDMNSEKYKNQRKKVIPVNEIFNIACDLIIIAIKDIKVANNVRKMLKSMASNGIEIVLAKELIS